MAMQLDFKECIQHIPNITGVLHVGACAGEEYDTYAELQIPRVVWIEANSDVCDALQLTLKERAKRYPWFKHTAHNLVVTDVDDAIVDFHITTNKNLQNDQRHSSSSVLALKKHTERYPHIVESSVRRLKTTRLDTFMNNHLQHIIGGRAVNKLNVLVLDIQGAELQALRGLGTRLHQFSTVYAEINTEELYEDCCTEVELDAFLIAAGFQPKMRSDTSMGWGDKLYVR